MTAPSDLIRREDVLKIVFPYACSEARKGELCLHRSCDNVRYSPILDALRALPADPVAEAALRLAEAWCLPGRQFSEKLMDERARIYRAAVRQRQRETFTDPIAFDVDARDEKETR